MRISSPLAIGAAAILTLPLTSAHAAPAAPGADAHDEVTSRAADRTAVAVRGPRRIAPGLTYREFARRGPVVGQILKANLTKPTLHPTYLHTGSVTARARLARQARRAGAVAGVNGDFFDIGGTDAPLGVGLDDGKLVNGPITGWNRTAAFDTDGPGTRARLARIRLAGTIRLPGGAALEATNLNSPRIAKGGIGIYTPQWGTEDRSQVIGGGRVQRLRARTAESGESVRLRRGRDDGAGARVATFEVVLKDGVVTRRRSTPGAAVKAGTKVLLGVGAGAQALADLRVGDQVDVHHRPASRFDAAVGITGNVILLRDGHVVAPKSQPQPRTAIGFSANGTRVWLVTVDGRSEASAGMTYARLARLLKSLGADDALNLDGGGSTTMVARMPGDNRVSVRNTPSDGAQRPVPNGLGFISAARD